MEIKKTKLTPKHYEVPTESSPLPFFHGELNNGTAGSFKLLDLSLDHEGIDWPFFIISLYQLN
jgi:hypothetical protein